MRGKTNLTRTFKLLKKELPPLHDRIISHYVKHPPKNSPKKVCSHMQIVFMKKVLPYFVGGEETLCFIFKSFPISKSSSLTFVVQTMIFQAKLLSHCF